MKSFRYFTEYVNASTPAFAVGGASTGPGMGQYSPVADLNAQKKKQRRVKQDPDIKDSPGTEPAKYYAKDASGKGMAKSTKQARDRHFTKGAEKSDDDPSAYKPAPGDKGAKTKLSKYTKKYRKMYGEDAEDDELARDMAAAQRKMQGAREKKRLKVRHKTQMDRLKTATPDEKKDLKTRQDAESKSNAIAIKRDIENIRRTEGLWDNIRKKKERIKKGSGEKMRKPGEKGAPTPAQLKRAQEDFELNEKIEGLVKKSEKSGIAYGILKKVYSRGMAAWRTGHRPGTTPQQWAFARVNSFITGGGARKSDDDLWRQHKGKCYGLYKWMGKR